MSSLYKYPRTPHLPFSLGATDDDKILKDTKHFENKLVVVTEKMDGENTSIYNNYYHARSLDSKHREYHSYLLSTILPNIQYVIPNGYRICGEYLYAKHSIYYDNLKDYFLTFSIWNENICLSWEDVEKLSNEWNLNLVPILYKGIYDENKIKELANYVMTNGGEGLVVRLQDPFKYEDFNKSIAKFVRPNHVQTDEHWTKTKIIKNELKK